MLKRLVVLVLLGACGEASVEEMESSQSLTGSGSGSGGQERGDPCDAKPIDSKGTLPACVAGTSTKAGPGRPPNLVTRPETMTPEMTSAADRANALSEARNPGTQSPSERGFAVPPVGAQ